MRLGDYLREDALKRLAVGFLIGAGIGLACYAVRELWRFAGF